MQVHASLARMKRLSVITAALALAGAATFSQTASPQTGTGWTQLFDGKSLEGFTQVGTANWRVEDGALVADKSTAPPRPDGQPGGGGHLVTKNRDSEGIAAIVLPLVNRLLVFCKGLRQI